MRQRLILTLERGTYQAAIRADEAEKKNHLATGEMTCEELIRILKTCRGDQHTSSPHHQDPDVLVHVFKPRFRNQSWYVKAYFDGDVAVFLSVHEEHE